MLSSSFFKKPQLYYKNKYIYSVAAKHKLIYRMSCARHEHGKIGNTRTHKLSGTGRESFIIPEPESKVVQNYREYSRIPSYQYSKMITLSRPSCLLVPI